MPVTRSCENLIVHDQVGDGPAVGRITRQTTRRLAEGNIAGSNNSLDVHGQAMWIGPVDAIVSDGENDVDIPTNRAGRPRTRRQAHRESMGEGSLDDIRVRRIVNDSMQGLRDELGGMIAEGFRNFVLADFGPDRQNERNGPAAGISNTAPHVQMARENADRNIREDGDDRVHRDGNATEEALRDTRDDDFDERRRSHRNVDADRGTERILNIMRNWRIKFTGDLLDFSVEDFIYRVETLTDTNLHGNFDRLCQHAHLLFEGKALKWYWRFHRNSGNCTWNRLTNALLKEFKNDYSDFEMKNDIRRRRQRPNESFDDFYDAVMVLCDRLKEPMSGKELTETMLYNLREEIRKELLHVDIPNISALRKEVRKHEKFEKDHSLGKFIGRSNPKYKQVSEMELKDEMDCISEKGEADICAVVKKNGCWNCGSVDHSFKDCMKARTVFCFGCGLKDMYRPKCPNCAPKRGNFQQDVRATMDGHPRN